MAIHAGQLQLKVPAAPVVVTTGRSQSLRRNSLRVLARDRLSLVAAAVLVVFAILAALAPLIAGSLGLAVNTVDLSQRFQAPSMAHWLGTDDFGRDQFARLLFGARVSLSVGFLAAFVNLTVGLGLGLTSALYGGRVDDLINWLVNTVRSIPGLFLLLIVAVIFRVGPPGLAVIIGLTSWTGGARLVRG